MSIIDYDALAYARTLYEEVDFKTIEVPWRVSTEIVNTTRPAGCTTYDITNTGKSLIASGEQGFMSLMNKGMLPPGKYQTITPCFRNEPYDATHSKQFMKLELIEVLPERLDWNQSEYMARMVQIVRDVMMKIAGEPLPIRTVPVETSDPLAITTQYDIEINVGYNHWIELGSYGARRAFFGAWVFGTGLAEPRFSKCLANLRQSRLST